MDAAMRTATIARKTSETSIDVAVNLDGTGRYAVSTGIGFFDHMLEQLSRHSPIDLDVKTVGDLHLDQHQPVEDTGQHGQASWWERRVPVVWILVVALTIK